MTRLEELLKDLCFDGVEYKKLKDISEMQRGTSLTKSKAKKGNIPVISGGKEPAFYCDTSNRKGEIITVAGSGAGAGYVQYWDTPIFANDCFTLRGLENVYTKYLYYCLANKQAKISNTKKGSGVPHVRISDIENFRIPVPPLEVQREIICILDSFTQCAKELTDTLTKEIINRKKQYEYYRDKLLTVEESVHSEKLKSISKISRGVRVTKSQLSDEGFPVYQNSLSPMGHYSEFNVLGGTTYIITAGAAGEIGFSNEDFWAADDCIVLTELKGVTNRYLYHFLMTKKEYIKSRVRKASIPRLSKEVIENLIVPVPSMEVQNKIINTLDNFDTVCSNLNIDVSSEIEARQKQYEYYRDLLLTFAETGNTILTDRQTDRQTDNN
ncbi:restriction endonuclease subunit S [Catenibacterium mitsuokai]|uniref:restriction endonuclease subunit S n=1 Tax=Catenibacterium mitsuokai TaxID=100886 RepID=UPI003F909006